MRPLKRPKRTSVTAASVPSTVATEAEMKATRSVTHAASFSGPSSRSAVYQRVEKPPHTVTSLESLNEYMTSRRIGM